MQTNLFSLCGDIEGKLLILSGKLSFLGKVTCYGNDCLDVEELSGLSNMLNECHEQVEALKNTELATLYEMAREDKVTQVQRINRGLI